MSTSRSRSMGRSLAAASAACLLFAGATFAHDSVTGASTNDPSFSGSAASETWDETDRGEVADSNQADEVDEFDETDRGEVADAGGNDQGENTNEAKGADTKDAEPPKAAENDQGENDQGDK